MPLEWVVVLFGVFIVLLFLFKPFRMEIVQEFQVGLFYRKGKFAGILKPGGYWILKRSRVQCVDLRKRSIAVPGQEVLSADNVALKISLLLSYEILDPVKAVHSVVDYNLELYTAAQLALRKAIGGLKIDDLLAKKGEVSNQVLETASKVADNMGIKLSVADIRDISFPGELKTIFAEVLRAQKEGLASLERARGETAALRNLANAAHMIDDNPNLLQLRLIQAISNSNGNTFVIGNPGESLVKGKPKTLPSKKV